MPPDNPRASGELFAELSHEMTDLVRQEIALAQTELLQKARQAAGGFAYLAAGALIAYAGYLALVDALIAVLATVLPRWLAATCVSLIGAGLGGFLVLRGMEQLMQTDVVPQRTLTSLKEDATWLKDKMK